MNNTIILALLETRSFSFSAIGHTEQEAIEGIERAWAEHRQQIPANELENIAPPVWAVLSEEFEARLLPMVPGQGYRDFEQITS